MDSNVFGPLSSKEQDLANPRQLLPRQEVDHPFAADAAVEDDFLWMFGGYGAYDVGG
jgi:hypothetical protein